tara:strand:+ start:4793 stop:5239 length:447 start_codon:yes stop_codon:yes gene_type:complete
MALPFELSSYHKSNTKSKWRNTYDPPLICTDEEFEEIYDRYIHCSKCELCDEVFKTTLHRRLDHCHNTGKFRNIVCPKCNGRKIDNKNQGKIDERYISKTFRKAKNCYQYSFQLRRNGKMIVFKRNKDLEKIIIIRDEWIKNNPQYFS